MNDCIEHAVEKIRRHAKEMEDCAGRLSLSANQDDWCIGYALKIRALGMETAAQVLMNDKNDL